MKARILLTMLSIFIMVISFGMRPGIQAYADDQVILKFNKMSGIQNKYANSDITVRGLAAGALPSVIGNAEGRLTASGKIYLTISGLVFDPGAPMVIAKGLENQNNIPSFRAIISCRTVNWGVVNRMTNPFPATTGLASKGGGSVHFETQVDIPKPCIDPVVFIAGPNSAWIAATPF